MKKLIFALTAIAVIALNAYGQSPDGFKYQAVIRDQANTILNNQSVGMRMSIQQGVIGGPTVYQETFTPTTNAYGLINLEIGSGTVVSGDFSTIDWANGPYFIETAVDVSGGSSYSVMGTSQLMSVPYALHANTAEIALNDLDTDPANEINTNLNLNGTYLQVTDGGGTIQTDLSSLQDGTGTDDQNISGSVLSGTLLTIGIEGGTSETVDLSSLQDADADTLNEIQTLSLANGNEISLSNGGGTISLSAIPGTLATSGVNWGLGSDPTSVTGFIGPTVTVNITSTSQVVHLVATKAMGSSLPGGAAQLRIWPGYKISTAAWPTQIGGGIYDLSCNQGERQPYTVSGNVTGLPPGTYQFGMLGNDDGNGNWNSNEFGYVTVLVFN